MIAWDARISKAIADAAERNAVFRKVADMCATHLIWFMGGGFGLVIYYLSKAVVDTLAIRLVAGVVLAWAATMALEYAFGRRRPFQEQRRKLAVEMLWVPPSFPSGHATIAFALATAVRELRDPSLYVIALVLAALVALGRVSVRVHYLTDVLAGAVVGIVVTSLVIRLI